MTVSRAEATTTPSIDDFFFAIALATELGSLAMRDAGTTSECSVCGERVALTQDQVEILTSSGTGRTWRTRRAETHARDCYVAHRKAVHDEAEQLLRSGFDLYA